MEPEFGLEIAELKSSILARYWGSKQLDLSDLLLLGHQGVAATGAGDLRCWELVGCAARNRQRASRRDAAGSWQDTFVGADEMRFWLLSPGLGVHQAPGGAPRVMLPTIDSACIRYMKDKVCDFPRQGSKFGVNGRHHRWSALGGGLVCRVVVPLRANQESVMRVCIYHYFVGGQ